MRSTPSLSFALSTDARGTCDARSGSDMTRLTQNLTRGFWQRGDLRRFAPRTLGRIFLLSLLTIWTEAPWQES
jgi:hypothetical protein